MIKFIFSAAMIFAFASSADAQTGQTGGAKPTPAQKLAPVLPAQPPQVPATNTKPSPVGQPITSTSTQQGYKPAPPPLKIKEPPSPK
ncbi:MAG TPA: hypothetical protein VJL90_03320 [Pseudorhodoplanes sp.]|nr:hypothetical protein [Pseudorhodoplanes sp.]